MDTTHQIAELFGLSCRCPFGAATEGCPAASLREQSLKERYDTIHNFAPHHIRRILDHHFSCASHREKTG